MADYSGVINTFIGLAVLMAVGFFLAKKTGLSDSAYRLTSELVIVISMPCLLFKNVIQEIEVATFLNGGRYLLAALAVILTAVLLSAVAARLLKVPDKRKGLFCVMCTFPNAILLGIPVCVGAFGEEAMPFIMFFYVVNTLLFWSLGYYLIRRDAGKASKLISLNTLKKTFASPPIIAFLAGLAMLFLNVQPPQFAMYAISSLASMTTPLAMVYIGMTLYRAGLKVQWNRVMVAILAFRFVLTPAMMFFAQKLIHADSYAASVLVLQMAMPVMTQTCVVAGREGADVEFATKSLVITTTLCLLTSPVIIFIFKALY